MISAIVQPSHASRRPCKWAAILFSEYSFQVKSFGMCGVLACAALIATGGVARADSPYSLVGTLTPANLSVSSSASPLAVASSAAGSFSLGASPGGAFDIVINPTPALAANPSALAAFNRAAAQWESRIVDPITVTIDADLAPLGAGILGSTNALALEGPYDLVRDQMVVEAAAFPDNTVVTHLPAAAQFQATLPAGRVLNGNLTLTKANAKALGFEDLDDLFGTSDGLIKFSNSFSFDFDNSDGVGFFQTDFETVAAHEIGHVLGFLSAVDDVNFGFPIVGPFTLDLFRFANDLAGQDPSNLTEFETLKRNLVPGTAAITDDLSNEYLMSTGLTNRTFPGTDGRQASHWKDDQQTGLPGPLIGLMDPSLAPGGGVFPFVEVVMPSDFRAMDLIGYDVVPEPSVAMLLMAGIILAGLSRHRAVR